MLSGLTSQAQHLHGIGVHFGGTDFYGPQTSDYFATNLYRISYNPESGKDDTAKSTIFQWNPTVRVSYWYQLNRWLDVSAGINISNMDMPMSKKDAAFINRKKYDSSTRNNFFFGSFDVRLSFNILPRDQYIISPYVFGGIAATTYKKDFNAVAPIGAGVNISLAKNLSLNLESAYKASLGDQVQAHLQHVVGIVYWFKPGYKKPVITEAPPFIDTDRDGITDSLDKCPMIAGLPNFDGCPDSDGDGVPDKDDACPLVAGLAALKGCPDSDGDGISDKDDKCPYVAGTTVYQGCPPPDKDGDGFLDKDDRCPDAYSKTNGGCPEIREEIINQVSKAAKAIFFETGKATLKPISNASLDAVVAVLQTDPSLYADIEGHTDNVGSEERNLILSQERADAVRTYFISKGIAATRLTATGFGKTQPVATNETAAGRAQNRRTEIRLRNYAK